MQGRMFRYLLDRKSILRKVESYLCFSFEVPVFLFHAENETMVPINEVGISFLDKMFNRIWIITNESLL